MGLATVPNVLAVVEVKASGRLAVGLEINTIKLCHSTGGIRVGRRFNSPL